MSRIGLSPICSPRSFDLLRKNRACLAPQLGAGGGTTADEQPPSGAVSDCQPSLVAIAQAVQAILQGVQGEAHLCRAFYLIREAFECSRGLAADRCPAEVGSEIERLHNEVSYNFH